MSALQNPSIKETGLDLRKEASYVSTWRAHTEIISQYTVQKNERFRYLSTYLLQAEDVHPPLYYDVIKTLCSVFTHMDLMLVGFLINIIFLLLTCIFIYKISLMIFDNSICAISAALLYGLSFSFINNVTFYRMYALLSFWLTFSVYINADWFVSGFKTDGKILLKLCITEFLAMSTQYFALFFCIPIFALNIFLIRSEKKKISGYIKYNVITGVIYLVTWPFAIVHVLFSDRGNDVTGNISGFNYIKKIADYNPILSKSIFAYSDKLFLLTFLVMIAVIAVKIIRKITNHTKISFEQNGHAGVLLYIFVVAFFYYFLAAIASPWTIDRYIFPAIPMFCVIVVYVFGEMAGVVIKNSNIIGLLIVLFAVALCARWHYKLTPEYLYNSPERVEYKNTCDKYDGIIIDKTDGELFSEIELNFPHTRIFRTNDDNLYTLEDNLSKTTSYMLYVNKNTDIDKVMSKIEKMGFDASKLDLDTDFYAIYKLN